MIPTVLRPLDTVRAGAAGAVRGVLAAPESPPPERFAHPAGDLGLTPPGPAWQVHADLSMFVGGVRALLLQAMHPLAMAGVADHSDYRHDPLGRLQRTAAFIGDTTFGSTEVAESAVRTVRAVHRRVVGVAPDGRPYRADDPELLTWVHCAEIDSFLAAHQRYGTSPLDPRGCDAYVAATAEVPRRLGATWVPTTVGELRGYLRHVRPELVVGRQARDAVRFLTFPPLPLVARAPYGLIFAAAVGLLPTWVRARLGLLTPPLLDPLVVRPAVRGLLGGLGWALGSNPALEAARRRVAAA